MAVGAKQRAMKAHGTRLLDPIRLVRMVNKVEWLEQETKTDATPSTLRGW